MVWSGDCCERLCGNLGCRIAAGFSVKDKAKPSDLIVVKDKAKPSDLIVHEWGTFLGMSGSDGASLDGMYHEEHALPAFVHSRSRDQLRLPFVLLKGETPVIYFYTKERQQVRVGVGFPRGVWTQWYPQAILVNPPLAENAEAPDRLERRADLLAGRSDSRVGRQLAVRSKLPATSSDALWNHARQVDAAYVKTSDAHQGIRQRRSSRSSCSTAAWARLVCLSNSTRDRTER